MRHIHFVRYDMFAANYQDQCCSVEEFFREWVLLPDQVTVKLWLGDQELTLDGRAAFGRWCQDNPDLLHFHMTKFWSSYTRDFEVCEAPCETMWELAE